MSRYDERHMKNGQSTRKGESTLHALYPRLSEEELRQVDEHLTEYLEVALGIYKSILANPEAYSNFKALTASESKTIINGNESNPT